MGSLHEVLDEAAAVALQTADEDGSLPAGTNGPWDDEETPVRATSHWTITFLDAYERTGDAEYRDAAAAAVDYLCSVSARPEGQTFIHRRTSEQDRANGVIGQAWTIEALAIAGDMLDRPDAIGLAEDVFCLHPFDSRLAAWKTVDIDGSVVGFDMTFNHQLWFAAAGAVLDQRGTVDTAVSRRVDRFLDELASTMQLHDSGAIAHLLEPAFDPVKYATIFADGLKRGTAHKMVASGLGRLLPTGETDAETDEWYERAVGYHTFNLYALGLLYEYAPTHEFWDTETFRNCLSYAQSDEFQRAIDENPYGYPFNVTGIEMAFVLETFGELLDGDVWERQRVWLSRQFDRTYDPDTGRLSKNTPDPITLTARLYEATRLPDIDLDTLP